MNAELRPFSLPLSDPLDTARGTIEHREGLLLRLEADGEGDDRKVGDQRVEDRGVSDRAAGDSISVGVGEATPLPGWTEHYDECERVLADAVEAIDRSDDPPSTLANLLGDLDSTPAARHALDLALADLDASRAGEPLYRYLGAAESVESVPVNATVGDGEVEETVNQAERAARAGFDCIKVKVGARPVSVDIERIEAVSEAVGPGDEVSEEVPAVELRADANGAWDRATAQQFLDAIGDELAYVEQPLPATDIPGLVALSGPVALDETLAAVEFENALDANPDAVVLKPMALGGPRRAVEFAERAREEGIEPVVTTTIDGAVARTAAVHVAAAIPDVEACGLATRTLLESDLGPDLAPVADGRAVVPQGDGNGTADTWGHHD